MKRLWSRPLARALVFSVAIGVFLSFVGAYGSAEAPFVARTALFLGFTTFGGVVAWGILHGTARFRWTRVSLLRRYLAVSVLMALVMGAAVWLALAMLTPRAMSLADLPRHAIISLITSFSLTGLAFAVFRPPLVTHAAPAGAAAPPRFLARLPAALKGGEVWAIEAEDHYLRIHTSRGSDLILMRLADAVAELEGIEGAQTHRSWWVARSAVRDVKRGDGRATFVLPDGKEAPVSRTYARALRAAGWF